MLKTLNPLFNTFRPINMVSVTTGLGDRVADTEVEKHALDSLATHSVGFLTYSHFSGCTQDKLSDLFSGSLTSTAPPDIVHFIGKGLVQWGSRGEFTGSLMQDQMGGLQGLLGAHAKGQNRCRLIIMQASKSSQHAKAIVDECPDAITLSWSSLAERRACLIFTQQLYKVLMLRFRERQSILARDVLEAYQDACNHMGTQFYCMDPENTDVLHAIRPGMLQPGGVPVLLAGVHIHERSVLVPCQEAGSAVGGGGGGKGQRSSGGGSGEGVSQPRGGASGVSSISTSSGRSDPSRVGSSGMGPAPHTSSSTTFSVSSGSTNGDRAVTPPSFPSVSRTPSPPHSDHHHRSSLLDYFTSSKPSPMEGTLDNFPVYPPTFDHSPLYDDTPRFQMVMSIDLPKSIPPAFHDQEMKRSILFTRCDSETNERRSTMNSSFAMLHQPLPTHLLAPNSTVPAFPHPRSNSMESGGSGGGGGGGGGGGVVTYIPTMEGGSGGGGLFVRADHLPTTTTTTTPHPFHSHPSQPPLTFAHPATLFQGIPSGGAGGGGGSATSGGFLYRGTEAGGGGSSPPIESGGPLQGNILTVERGKDIGPMIKTIERLSGCDADQRSCPVCGTINHICMIKCENAHCKHEWSDAAGYLEENLARVHL